LRSKELRVINPNTNSITVGPLVLLMRETSISYGIVVSLYHL